MTKRLLLAVAAVALCACPSEKITWTPYSAGPISLEFPCAPEKSVAVTKCMRSDGTLYSLSVVDKEKDVTAQQALQEAVDYAKGLPKTEVLSETFPVKWREVRQFGMIESAVWFVGGKDYTVSVQYSTQQPPPQLAEFFSKVKVQ